MLTVTLICHHHRDDAARKATAGRAIWSPELQAGSIQTSGNIPFPEYGLIIRGFSLENHCPELPKLGRRTTNVQGVAIWPRTNLHKFPKGDCNAPRPSGAQFWSVCSNSAPIALLTSGIASPERGCAPTVSQLDEGIIEVLGMQEPNESSHKQVHSSITTLDSPSLSHGGVDIKANSTLETRTHSLNVFLPFSCGS